VTKPFYRSKTVWGIALLLAGNLFGIESAQLYGLALALIGIRGTDDLTLK